MTNLWYHFSYFIQVLIFSVFWVYRLKRRNYFVLRLIGCIVVSCGLVVLVSYIESLIGSLLPENRIVFSMPYIIMMALFGVSYGICFDISIDRILFVLLLPTTAQLCSSALGNIIFFLTEFARDKFYLCDIISTAIICIACSGLVKLYNKINFYDKGIYKFAIISSYCIVVCIFVLNGFTSEIEDFFTRYIVVAGYRFLMSVFVFFLVFSLLGLGSMRYQKSLTEVLLKKEEQQHALASELTELINIKYHDIKHMEKSGTAQEFVRQDEKLLDLYGCMIDCGNPALNTVLTEKNIICKGNGIDFTVMADGGLLSFMQPTDIYSLFGNALDNAIECLKTLPEEERHVKLQIKNIGDMVNILCENACHTKLKFENGLPRTTNGDTYNHGFGTKSIASVCKKYKAEFRMATDGALFTLNVLMPAVK